MARKVSWLTGVKNKLFGGVPLGQLPNRQRKPPAIINFQCLTMLTEGTGIQRNVVEPQPSKTSDGRPDPDPCRGRAIVQKQHFR